MWVKFDDRVSLHRKVVAAGNEAFGAWVRITAHAAAQESDGFIEQSSARIYATPKILRKLVEVGLLDVVEGRDGYQVHDFLDYNPSKSQLDARRAANARRQEEWRKKQEMSDAEGESNGVTNAVSNSAPTRPDPIRSEVRKNKDPRSRARVSSKVTTVSDVTEIVTEACKAFEIPMISNDEIAQFIDESGILRERLGTNISNAFVTWKAKRSPSNS